MSSVSVLLRADREISQMYVKTETEDTILSFCVLSTDSLTAHAHRLHCSNELCSVVLTPAGHMFVS